MNEIEVFVFTGEELMGLIFVDDDVVVAEAARGGFASGAFADGAGFADGEVLMKEETGSDGLVSDVADEADTVAEWGR